MTTDRTPQPANWHPVELKKDGTVSKMRSHKGNIPVLPQNKLCPHCPAKFTRTTHLNRHLRTHSNERLHRCNTCSSQFTRSDLLTRHKRSCNDSGSSSNRTRRKSCKACSESKIKCDLQYPRCSKCTSRGKECIFPGPTSKDDTSQSRKETVVLTPYPEPTSPSTASSTPSTMFAPTPEASGLSYANDATYCVIESDNQLISEYPSISSGFSFSASQLTPSKATSVVQSVDDANAYYSGKYPVVDVDVDSMIPTNSHLGSLYSRDMFEPFFTNIFAEENSPSTAIVEDNSWAESVGFVDPQLDFTGLPSFFNAIVGDCHNFDPMSMFTPSIPRSIISDVRHSDHLALANMDPPPAELQNYLYLFLSAFVSQMPIVHAATFQPEGKPQVLLNAMQACGALFVKTRRATTFITKTLDTARETLVHEFAKNPTDSMDQVHLILAVVLLQTIGLFHQKADQRASSSIYHGMLVMMIRRTGLIATNGAWQPMNFSEEPLEKVWKDWAIHEMTKRALTLSYLHDCCHCIYFALPPSYSANEIDLYLPCEDALWTAKTAADWYIALQGPSPYGSFHSRLTGISMPKALSAMAETRLLTNPTPLNPFSHFVLCHTILRHLFSVCVESRLAEKPAVPNVDQTDGITEDNQQIFGLQYALHNWLQSWMASPDLPKLDGNPSVEPPFIHNALPFYWLGQVTLLAFQEGLPPFQHGSPNNLKAEVRFKLVKQWLKHIREFLVHSDETPTLFWDELMKIRLKTWQLEVESDGADDPDGLLGFFPDH